MLQVNEAAKIAEEALKGFYPNVANVQLEEVEFDEGRKLWLITLSYIDPEAFMFPTFPKPRNFKLFTIEAESGNMLSMKIRELK